mgnify:CR=1 FL=1
MEDIAGAVYAGYQLFQVGRDVYHYFVPPGKEDDKEQHAEFRKVMKGHLGKNAKIQRRNRQDARIHNKFTKVTRTRIGYRQKIKDMLSKKPTKTTNQDSTQLWQIRSDPTKKRLGKNINKRMPRGRRYRPRRRKRVATKFPDSQLVKLHSYHTGYIDPATGGATAYATINVNNPINPLGTGVNWTAESTEHHPQYWDIYEQVYNKFEVVSANVSVQYLMHQETFNHMAFIVPASTEALSEVTTQIGTAKVGLVRLKESNPRAIVKFASTAAEQAGHYKLFNKINIRKLEGMKDKGSDVALLQGTTSASGSEAAPTRTPAVYAGVGAISANDLATVHLVIKIEYMILFSDAKADKSGLGV